MNQKQYEDAYEALAADCEIVGKYVNDDGQTCAVGKLAQMAGIEDYMLYALNEDGDRAGVGEDGDGGYIYTLHDAIKQRFGLPEQHLNALMLANDAYDPSRRDWTEDARLTNRRRRVLGVLNDIAIEAGHHGGAITPVTP